MPQQYVNMTGEGELWVDSSGLPMRQILRLDFPAIKDDQVKADITVDFSFSIVASAQPMVVRLSASAVNGLRSAVIAVAMLAVFTILIALSRSRRVYIAIVIVVITSMVLSPLMQAVQAAQFAERLATRQRVQDDRTRESEMQRALEDKLQAKPVAASGPATLNMIRTDTGKDSDRDGFSDVQELFLKHKSGRSRESLDEAALGRPQYRHGSRRAHRLRRRFARHESE